MPQGRRLHLVEDDLDEVDEKLAVLAAAIEKAAADAVKAMKDEAAGLRKLLVGMLVSLATTAVALVFTIIVTVAG